MTGAERLAENKALMRRIARIFETGDLTEAKSVIAAEYVDHQGLDGIDIRGVDGFSRVVTAARRACPDLRVGIVDLIAEGDRVVARLRWHEVRPTGERVGRETIEIVRVENGRAIEHWGMRLPGPR